MNETSTPESRLLTDADLVELTGLTQPSAQIRMLREYGLMPIVRRDGKPRLTWDALTAIMAGSAKEDPPAGRGPNWAALDAINAASAPRMKKARPTR